MTWFFGSRKSLLFVLTLAFIAAIGIRFYDLTDLPFDFASTRQMFSSLKARGIYYNMLPADYGGPQWQRDLAIRQWRESPVIEPPIIETITALTYQVAGEHLWIARIYSSLFWVLAGILLFLLAQELAGPSGAFISLLFYLFLPVGVIASRTFQPDPLMVALIIAGAWATFHWSNQRTMKWAIIAGIFNSLAIFVKNVAVFPLGFAAIALVLEYGLLKSLKDKQTWIVAILSGLLPAGYTLYGLFISGFLNQQLAFRFFPEFWSEPGFYLRWKGAIDGVIGFGAFATAISGIFVAKKRGMAFLIGLWLGYFAYGMAFAYHITTHEYYQLMLIPIVAISLAPVAEALFDTANRLGRTWFVRALFSALIALVVAIQIWNVRVELIRDDWRPDAEFWTTLGEKLGQNGPVLAIAQDYGYRLAYWGWQDVYSWYDSGDLDIRILDGRRFDLAQRFQDLTSNKRFLVVTQLNRFEQQPDIKDFVYKTYPIFAEGKGYVVFDLAHPK
jgi:4-amino-4-deoxy-L-arabinose transferase-like glycosyltransferase